MVVFTYLLFIGLFLFLIFIAEIWEEKIMPSYPVSGSELAGSKWSYSSSTKILWIVSLANFLILYWPSHQGPSEDGEPHPIIQYDEKGVEVNTAIAISHTVGRNS